jgi:hypothetical protein
MMAIKQHFSHLGRQSWCRRPICCQRQFLKRFTTISIWVFDHRLEGFWRIIPADTKLDVEVTHPSQNGHRWHITEVTGTLSLS